MDDIKKLLGKRIREIRKSKNLTQEKLAEMIEIGFSSLSYIETGRNYPSPETLQKICKVFNVEPCELFKFTPDKSDEEMLEEIVSTAKRNKKLLRQLYYFYRAFKWG